MSEWTARTEAEFRPIINRLKKEREDRNLKRMKTKLDNDEAHEKWLENQIRILEDLKRRGKPLPRWTDNVKSYPSLEAFREATGRSIDPHSKSG